MGLRSAVLAPHPPDLGQPLAFDSPAARRPELRMGQPPAYDSPAARQLRRQPCSGVRPLQARDGDPQTRVLQLPAGVEGGQGGRRIGSSAATGDGDPRRISRAGLRLTALVRGDRPGKAVAGDRGHGFSSYGNSREPIE